MVKRRIDDLGLWTLVVVVGLVFIFLVVPILVAIAMSFDGRSYMGRFPPPEYSIHWYVKFFSDSYFINGLRTSLILATLAAVVSTTIGVAAALALDRYAFKGKEVLTSFFFSPLIVPAVVVGFALLMFFSMMGVHDGFLRLLGGHVIVTLPYTIRTTLAGLVGIRPSLLEAALTLGANERQAFWGITFPLAKTGIVAGAVFAFAFSLDDVAISIFLSDTSSYTLPVALISMMRANFDLTIAAASVLLTGFTLILIVVLDRIVGLDQIIGQGIYRA